MLLATRGGNREVRAEFGSSAIPAWSRYSGMLSHSNKLVTVDEASGLPAVGSAIRLISETTAMLPLLVYRGRLDKKKLAKGWQYSLVHDRPNQDQSAFDFWQDVSATVESTGNAFIRKVKLGPNAPRVEEMYLMDQAQVRAVRDDAGRKVFEIWNGGRKDILTSSEVLHVRGFTIRGGDMGITAIQLHRHFLGSALSLDEYEGRFFANDASPGVVIQVEGPPNREQAERIQGYWEATHGGTGNAHKPALLFGNAKLNTYGISLKDAQFVESQRFGVEQVARIFRVPKSMLELESSTQVPEQEMIRFLNLGLQPRLTRITSALAADPDFFGTDDPYPEFDTQALLRTDVRTMWEAWHHGIQTGVLIPDEIRAELGRPPLPDGLGQIPQVTPVGGAPNPAPPPAPPAEPPPPPQANTRVVLEPGAIQVRHESHIDEGAVQVPVQVQPAEVRIERGAVQVEPPPAAAVTVNPEVQVQMPKRSLKVKRDHEGRAIEYEES